MKQFVRLHFKTVQTLFEYTADVSQMLLCTSRWLSIIPPLKYFQFGIPKLILLPYAAFSGLLKRTKNHFGK